MSTSPEAKQAAEELRARYRGALIYGDEGLWQAVAEGYDAATAKLREAFEQYVSNEGGMNFEKFAAIMRGQQLARQQPSASSYGAQTDQLYSHDKADAPVSKSSATTPDVEQLAREAAKKLPTGPGADAYPKAVRVIVEALAQVRTPLVEDQLRLDELSCGSRFTGNFDYLASEWTITINETSYRGKTIREAIDKSLTGTGEK